MNATPLELDRRSREENVGLKDLMRAIPADCLELQPLKAWGGLIRNAGLLVLFQVGLASLSLTADATLLLSLPLALVLWCLSAWAMAGIFLVGHDCGHMSFSRRRWVNVVMGHLCTSFFFSSFTAWRLGHNKHHTHPNLRGVDTNWPEQLLTREEFAALPWGKKLETLLGYGTPLGVLVGNWIGQARYALMEWAIPQIAINDKNHRLLWLSNAFMLLATGSLVGALLWFGGAWVFAKHYGIPVVVGFATAALFTHLQHLNEDALVFDREDYTPFRGQVLSTFDVRFPWVVEFLCMNITLHLVHHVTTRVPWYHLPRASAAIKAAYPAYYQERRFSLRALWRTWRRPLLERNEAAGVYTLAPAPPLFAPLRAPGSPPHSGRVGRVDLISHA